MFVKIIREVEGQEFTSVYECRMYHMRPHETNTDAFYLTMEAEEGNSITVEIDKMVDKIGVYVTNNHGSTVDTIFSNRR